MLIKHLNNIAGIATSHGCGNKKVLLSKEEAISAITQIAITTLLKGEKSESHSHPTMEECFMIRKGMVKIVIESQSQILKENDFVCISPGEEHSLTALTDCEFMTISCATD